MVESDGYYNHPCAWVAMGLDIGCISVGVLCLAVTLLLKITQRSVQRSSGPVRYYDAPVEPARPQSKPQPRDMSYIEEIKQLKELLDSGALTQEEYDMLKKEILEN